MNRKELIERELEDLPRLAQDFVHEVEAVVTKIRNEENEKCTLYLTDKDKYRLLILRSWTIRYKVSLRYILNQLLPFWESFIQRRSKKMKSRGLNVQVSTLTGKKSEDILKQCIEKDYPNNLNISLWKTSEQERLYKAALEAELAGIKVRQPNIKTLERYVTYYKYSVSREVKRRERVERSFQKMPYRDNAFTE
jgi:hypothetical protein